MNRTGIGLFAAPTSEVNTVFRLLIEGPFAKHKCLLQLSTPMDEDVLDVAYGTMDELKILVVQLFGVVTWTVTDEGSEALVQTTVRKGTDKDWPLTPSQISTALEGPPDERYKKRAKIYKNLTLPSITS